MLFGKGDPQHNLKYSNKPLKIIYTSLVLLVWFDMS